MRAFTLKLHHWLIVPVLVLFAAALQTVIWSFDREPPFETLSSELAGAQPGQIIIIRSTVRRDLGRGCAAYYSRSVIDSTGVRHDLDGTQYASAATIAHLDRVMGSGRLLVAFIVPFGAQLGPASLVTSLQYRCNPLHSLWPIDVVTVVPFEVR